MGISKTNVMRILDKEKILYQAYQYDSELVDGQAVAQAVGAEAARTFKTLVTQANTKEYLVFMLPVSGSLDLKKAAQAAGVKSVAMIPQKELLPLTGYVHGGCSPIGMKKPFRTFLDESALHFETILFSAGKRGVQVELDPQALLALIGAVALELQEKKADF